MKSILMALMFVAGSLVAADEFKMLCVWDDPEDFSTQLTNEAKQGWELKGPSLINLSQTNSTNYCQLLVKHPKPAKKIKMVKAFFLQCWVPGDGRVTQGIQSYMCDGWEPYGQLLVAYGGKEVCQSFTKMVPESEFKCPEVKP